MVELIVGANGKGKSKFLIEKVNEEIQKAQGSIVYIDKSIKYMHDLGRGVRLINIRDYPIRNSDEFFGFLYGILSQDSDLEQIYIDNLHMVANVLSTDAEDVVSKFEKIGEKHDVKFLASVSWDIADLSQNVRSCVTMSM